MLQGHFRSARRAHDEPFEVRDRTALLLRQPEVHPHVLAAAQHPEGLGAEEGGSRLARQILQSQTQRAGRRLEFQLNLPESVVLIGADIEDAVDLL